MKTQNENPSNKAAAKNALGRQRAPKVASEDTSNENQQRDTATLSVRLTEEQRERLATAALLRGWTPTTLLRIAAMEKAAHILNTSIPTNVDLRKVADAVAGRL